MLLPFAALLLLLVSRSCSQMGVDMPALLTASDEQEVGNGHGVYGATPNAADLQAAPNNWKESATVPPIAEQDPCKMLEEEKKVNEVNQVEDIFWYATPFGSQNDIAVFLNDHVATSTSFLNSYPVVSLPARSLKAIYGPTYDKLEKNNIHSIQLDAGYRTSAMSNVNQTFRFFLKTPVGGQKMYVEFAVRSDSADLTGGAGGIQNLGTHLRSAKKVLAADNNIFVIEIASEKYQMLVRNKDQSWSTYDYGREDIVPTGILEMKTDSRSVTYMLLFQTLYAFYRIDSNPVTQVIRSEWIERHFDNKRLLSCPVHPCEDFRLDAAVKLGDKYHFMSGLHIYTMVENSKTRKLVPNSDSLPLSNLDSSNLENKRVDAAFTAYDSTGKIILFLVLNENLLVVRVNDVSDVKTASPLPGQKGLIPVSKVFAGVTKVDAAVSVPRMKANLIWLFHGHQYFYFEFAGADISLNSKLPTFEAKESGSISKLLPGLYTPLDAAMVMPVRDASSSPKARFFVDNWYYDGFLNGDRVQGPFLMQETLFECGSHNYTKGSFGVLQIHKLIDFSRYMSQFVPVRRAEANSKTHEIILFSLIGVAAFIVIVSIGICICMWRKTHKEKTRGFHATKKKFKYDYD